MLVRRASVLIDRWKWLPIAIGGTWLTVGWISIILKPRGDFPNHWEMGRRILAGEFIYKGSLNGVYPPFWALAHAPLALVDKHLAQIIAYPLAVAAMVLLFWTLHQLSRDHLPLDRNRLFWSTVLTIVLASQFLSRDLPEVGINTALVALSWLAIHLWSKGRDLLAGTSLGFAAALKSTPLLFVAYFALKGQWKMVVASSAAFIVFSLSPLFVQGPDLYTRAMETWTGIVIKSFSDPDPSRGVLGEAKVENLALRPALARYLMHLPYGHLGRPETSDTPERPNRPPTPLYVHFGNLPAHQAGLVATTIMLGLLLTVIWVCRWKITSRQDPFVIYECAVVSLMILLYSPVTWKQHGAGVVPALYLICRNLFANKPMARWVITSILVYGILAVILNREIIGRDMTKLLDSYHVKTLAIGLLIPAVFYCRLLAARRPPAVTPLPSCRKLTTPQEQDESPLDRTGSGRVSALFMTLGREIARSRCETGARSSDPPKAYLKRYVEGLSGKAARLAAG